MNSISPIKYSWRHPIKKLDALTANRPGIRKLAKYGSPLASALILSPILLTAPGALTLGGLLLYAVVTAGPTAVISWGLSKSFKLAALERTGVRTDVSALEEKISDLRDERRGLLDQVAELEKALRETQMSPIRDSVAFDGRNVFIKELGRGGMAVALQIFDTKLREMRVWKVPLPDLLGDQNYVERFIRGEAKSMVGINHPNVVRFFQLGEMNREIYEKLTETPLRGINLREIPYIEMEYVGHPTLEQKLRFERKKGYQGFPPSYALRIALAVAETMKAVCIKGIIHRDLKPDNIFIVPDESHPGEETVKIGDFGLAKQVGVKSRYTQIGSAMGTPEYMSPEQWMGAEKIDWRTDLYALGCILCEMIAGDPPYGYLQEEENPMVYGQRVVNSDKPLALREKLLGYDSLAELISKMLAKDPQQRFASWEDCINEIKMTIDSFIYGATAVAQIDPSGKLHVKNR